MKISIDCRMVGNRMTGVGRHVGNLVRELINIDHQNEYLLIYRSKQFLDIIGAPMSRDHVDLIQIDEDFFNRVYSPTINRVLKDRSVDLYHFPYFNCPFPVKAKKVITIHDVNPLIDPQCFEYNKRIRPYYRLLLDLNKRRANRIITISEFARESIVEHLGVQREKVKAIYLGINKKFCPRADKEEQGFIKEKYGLERDYLLYVGNLLPHKNVAGLLKSFSEVHGRISSDLAIVGDDEKSSHTLVGLAVELGIGNRVRFVRYVDEGDMPLIYAYSKAFVSLSKLEGFGLPLLEAMACGVPAVVSNRCSLPEIAGDAALVVDIDQPSQIQNALVSIDGNEMIRHSLSKKGLERAEEFSWERCAKETLQVYEEVAG